MLAVEDVGGCATFYRDKLGFHLDEMHDEDAYLSFGPGAPVLALKTIALAAKEVSESVIRPNEEAIKRTQLVVFVSDVDAEYAELRRKGARFVNSPSTKEGGWRTAHFVDPEGNLWEISQRPRR
ncbi:MAG: VOC family protein [Nitrososphaerota archaeon]|nr:VOC family protein [Nitrososphaerota archaeon]